MNEIIYINKIPHFQCNFCGKIYCAYPVADDTRGDDEVRDSKLAFRQTNPYFGKNLLRIWDLHKKQKQVNQVI